MFSLARAAVLLAAAQAAIAAVLPRQGGTPFQWGSETIRGVNIGGWLVLEPWITPSIFQAHSGFTIVDEYTLGQTLGHDAAHDILKSHWDSWITEDDFHQIAQWGFNAVRIPIGFWAYNTFGTPYVQGAAPYLVKAVGWARNAGLKVLVDLHGAPLSQNGFDNSGQRLDNPGWQGGDSVDQTLQVLSMIANQFADPSYNDVVMGIELLNEPLGPKLDTDVLRQFMRDGYGRVRQVNGRTTVVLQDAFSPPSSYNGFLTPSDNNAQNVAIDHHEYQVFNNDQLKLSPGEHNQAVCNNAASSYGGADKWAFVGEWTAAMTDCAAALNGYGIGARYDGYYPGSSYIGSCDNINFIETWSDQLISDTRAYVEAQLQAFETETNGWFFWTYKTEASAEWDLGRLIKVGAFPQPLNDRRFAPACTNL